MFSATPRDVMLDPQRRPYFLWDMDMTIDDFERAIAQPSSPERSYLIGKLMRQAKPDDMFQFLTLQQVADLWPSVELPGQIAARWDWLLEQWESRGYLRRP
jgi:hypothetical protein